MSNLLEEAIVDAAALRETALKSAEAALIEKYSKEFKDSVQKLLEQEAMVADPTAAAPAMGAPAMAYPLAAAPMTQEKPGGEAFAGIPSSFLNGDDDELITIEFDKLVAPPPEETAPEMETPEMPEMAADMEIEQPADMETPDVSGQEEQPMLSEEFDLDEEELQEMHDAGGRYEMGEDALYEEEELNEEEPTNPEVMAAQKEVATAQTAKAAVDGKLAKAQASLAQAQADAAKKKQDADAAAAAISGQAELEEDFSITEEELQELAEEMKVDLKPEHQLRGYMGSTVLEKELAGNVEKAAARDYKDVKKREEQEEAMSDLKDKLKESIEENEKLKSFVEELSSNLSSLQEHVEKMSVSNAKLLYTNKVLADVSLNERQKQQIVESISKSTSVLEAKTIFGTLQSAVQNVSEKKPRESLSEALIRGPSPFLNRQKVSSPEDNMVDRMKKLAGIK